MLKKLFPQMKFDEAKMRLRKQPALDAALAKIYKEQGTQYNCISCYEEL